MIWLGWPGPTDFFECFSARGTMVTVSHADAEHWQHSGGVLVTFNQFLCGPVLAW